MKKTLVSKTSHHLSGWGLVFKVKRFLIFGFSTLFILTSCGGGDSTNQAEEEPISTSNWDSMRWDQDNWQ